MLLPLIRFAITYTAIAVQLGAVRYYALTDFSTYVAAHWLRLHRISSELYEGRGLRKTTGRFRKTKPGRTTICLQAKEELVRTQAVTPQLARNYPT